MCWAHWLHMPQYGLIIFPILLSKFISTNTLNREATQKLVPAVSLAKMILSHFAYLVFYLHEETSHKSFMPGRVFLSLLGSITNSF